PGSPSSCPPRSPRSPITSPGTASSDSCQTACVWPNAFEIPSTLRHASAICSPNVAHTSPIVKLLNKIVKLLNKDVMKRAATECPCRSAESGKQTCPPVPSPFAAQDGAIPADRPAARCSTRLGRGSRENARHCQNRQ